MKRTYVAGFAILTGIGLAAQAFGVQPSAPLPEERTQAAAASDYSNKLICKRELPIGSKIPKTVCRTQAQIDAERGGAMQNFQRATFRRQGTNLPESMWDPR
jgi:hypothetical protein